MYINFIIVAGNVVRDPEVRTTANGKQVATFTVATNRTWRKEDGTKDEDAEFHDVVAWGFYAELAARLQKGHRVVVLGRMQTRNWEDQEGRRHYRKEIVASNIILHNLKPTECAGFNGVTDEEGVVEGDT